MVEAPVFYTSKKVKKAEHNLTSGEIQVTPLSPEELASAEQRTVEEDALRVVQEQEREDNFTFDGVMLTIAKAFLNHENRIRSLEGKQPVTLKQLIKALRAL